MFPLALAEARVANPEVLAELARLVAAPEVRPVPRKDMD
jgi:hypothetical protein